MAEEREQRGEGGSAWTRVKYIAANSQIGKEHLATSDPPAPCERVSSTAEEMEDREVGDGRLRANADGWGGSSRGSLAKPRLQRGRRSAGLPFAGDPGVQPG